MEQSFSRAVDFIYDAALQPTLWPQALQAVADCFQDIGAVLIWRRDDGGFGTIVSPGLSAAHADYEANWQMNDPRPVRSFERAFLAPRDVITDLDVMTAEEIETLPIYTRFLARYGLGWFASTMLSPDVGRSPVSVSSEPKASRISAPRNCAASKIWRGISNDRCACRSACSTPKIARWACAKS